MKEIFANILISRGAFLRLVEPLSIEQLNKIPDGFSNNIAWNLGHLVVSTPALCYLRTAVKPDLQIPSLEKYVKGSRPESFTTPEEISQLKAQLLDTIPGIEQDYHNGIFKTISPFATGTYKHLMQSIEEVLCCTLAHDNYHFGYSVALKKAILQ